MSHGKRKKKQRKLNQEKLEKILKKQNSGETLSPVEYELLLNGLLGGLLKCAEKVQKTCKLSKDVQKMEMECIKKIWVEYGEKLQKIMQIHSTLKQHIEKGNNGKDERNVSEKYDIALEIANVLRENIEKFKDLQ